jgi:cellulose synthase/poly-beta-1,6-N-acetylglucosamine synthase-like glycosyltransferase
MSSVILASFVVAFAYLFLLNKYRKLWVALETNGELSQKFSVTVLVPFRNEETNLPKLLESFNNLNLSNLEIQFCFIDDHSTDQSSEIVTKFLKNNKGQIVTLTQEQGKKAAIALGWQNISTELIVQTDADCEVSENWLQHLLISFQDEEVNLVSGPVQFYKEDSFFKNLVALDFAGLIAIGAAHTGWQKALICNGANLAYRSEVIKKVDLKTSKASGEDVFLMESVVRNFGQKSIAFCKRKQAMVKTLGPQSFKEFWNQRLRWASKNGDYANKLNVSILGFVWAYNLAILGFVVSLNSTALTLALFLVLIKLMAEMRFYESFENFFSKRDAWKNLLLGQPFHILYMALLPIFSLILKYQWKERKQK